MYKKLMLILALTSLVGCAGTMQGMVRDNGERISIKYEQGLSHDNLEVTLPDGETFKGKVVMVGSSTSISSGFDSASAYDSTGNSAFGTASTFGTVNTYTGNMQGILFGDKKHTMRCRFQYADSTGFTSSGGVGICETSGGKVVDVQW